MSNNLDGLNDHLFAQINRLEKASSPEDLQQEISRSDALVDISTQVVANASLALKAAEFAEKHKQFGLEADKKNPLRKKTVSILPETMPSMLAIGPSVKD